MNISKLASVVIFLLKLSVMVFSKEFVYENYLQNHIDKQDGLPIYKQETKKQQKHRNIRGLQSFEDIIVNPLVDKSQFSQQTLSYLSDTEITQGQEQLYVFDLKLHDLLEITFDFRHLYNQKIVKKDGEAITFDYSKAWEISLIMDQNITDQNSFDLLDETKYVNLPFQFHNNTDNMESQNTFKVFIWKDSQFIVGIKLKQQYYINQRFNFYNTAGITIKSPYRATYNKPDIFAFILMNDDSINLPVNYPVLNEDDSYPNYLVSHYQNGLDTLTRNEEVLTSNYFSANSMYWREKTQIVTPYLPFFSNCKNFGNYIFFQDIVENEENCQLKSPSQTKPIKQLSFGTVPVADECSNIQFDCIYDEYLNNPAQPSRWFEQALRNTIFYITPEPVQLTREYAKSKQFKLTDLIAVKFTDSSIPEKHVPYNIELKVYYYQKNKTRKIIVSSDMIMKTFQEIKSKEEQMSYQLKIEYRSMTHSELTIAFALEWSVYFVLYIGVGIFSAIELIIFFLYHYLLNRKSPRPPFHFKIYMTTLYPEIFTGIFLATIPISLLVILLSVIMTGTFWDRNTKYINCEAKACKMSIFDEFTYREIDYTQVTSFEAIRAGRTGTAILAVGFYVLYYMSSIYLPRERSSIMKEQTYYVNTWEKMKWERSFFSIVTIIVICYYTNIIMFSYSNYYATNLWTCIIFFKICQLVIEYFMQKILQNDLLFNVLQPYLSTLISLVTMGANDFFEFLFSYFVSLGMMMAERLYVPLVQDYIISTIEVKLLLLYTYIIKFFSESDEEDDDKDQEDNDIQMEEKQNDSDVEILLSEQDQYTSGSEDSLIGQIENFDLDPTRKNKKGDKAIQSKLLQNKKNMLNRSGISEISESRNSQSSNKQLGQRLLYQQALLSPKNSQFGDTSHIEDEFFQNEDSNSEEENGDNYENTFQNNLNNKLRMMAGIQEQQHQIKRFPTAKPVVLNEEQQKLHVNDIPVQGYISTDKQSALSKFAGFANDTMVVSYFPFYLLIIWVFYDENQICSKYNIPKPFMIFYMLFVILIVPFQLIIDMFFFNIVKNYHHICFINYLNALKIRFKMRKRRWMTAEQEYDQELDPALQGLDQWCYSSQYYFISALSLFALTFINMGIMTLINHQHNPAEDRATVFIILFFVAMCYSIQKLSIWISKQFKLWKSASQLKQMKQEQKILQQKKLLEDQMKKQNIVSNGDKTTDNDDNNFQENQNDEKSMLQSQNDMDQKKNSLQSHKIVIKNRGSINNSQNMDGIIPGTSRIGSQGRIIDEVEFNSPIASNDNSIIRMNSQSNKLQQLEIYDAIQKLEQQQSSQETLEQQQKKKVLEFYEDIDPQNYKQKLFLNQNIDNYKNELVPDLGDQKWGLVLEKRNQDIQTELQFARLKEIFYKQDRSV